MVGYDSPTRGLESTFDYPVDWGVGPSEPFGTEFFGETLVRPHEIRIPSGALVELSLVRPLILP